MTNGTRMGVNSFVNEARVVTDAILDKLDNVIEAVQQDYLKENFQYQTQILNTLTDTVATGTLLPPPGTLWRIRRIAVTGGANGAVAFYLNEAQPQNLLDGLFTNAVIGAWAPDGDGLYIPMQQSLVTRFYNQPNNQVCTVNFRITEISLGE